MSQRTNIEQKLQSALEPIYLEVNNESHMHNVPPGSESHFRVVVVSATFEDKPLLGRHRLVNEILAEELPQFHALALHTYTPQEWADKGRAPQSPPCEGGGRQQ